MGLDPVCYVCTPQSCDIYDQCKGARTLEEATIATEVAKDLDVRQVRAEACRNPWKRAAMLWEVAELRRLIKKESLEGNGGSLKTYRIRYEGTVHNPRFRGFKRRTCSIVSDEEGAKAYARSLEQGQGVKVLWIRPKEPMENPE
jgi:hypothetical protein